MTDFKIGDRVRVVSVASGYRGQAGTITGVQYTPGVSGEAPDMPGYVVELDSGRLEFFTGTDLEQE